MTIGEIYGIRLKLRLLRNGTIDKADEGLGSVMAVATTLFTVWLIGSILVLGPVSGLQQEVKNSHIISRLTSTLPPATKLLSSLDKLVNPNGFPEVFRGLEPNPGNATLPDLGSFNDVVATTRASVVKVEGTGCGGIVEGTGFVFADGRIATNAHVVAGVSSPKVLDEKGLHDTRVVLFDPDVDLAVLVVNNLAGKPLAINSDEQAGGTPGVVLGYPGGGNFDAQPAAVIDRFSAYGRNIYGQGNTVRDVYSMKAKVIPGNSGGPVIDASGKVMGVVFATSTTYNNVGYALTGQQVAAELATAATATNRVATGSCSE
jgi:S1-C subfamily serine protease